MRRKRLLLSNKYRQLLNRVYYYTTLGRFRTQGSTFDETIRKESCTYLQYCSIQIYYACNCNDCNAETLMVERTRLLRRNLPSNDSYNTYRAGFFIVFA